MPASAKLYALDLRLHTLHQLQFNGITLCRLSNGLRLDSAKHPTLGILGDSHGLTVGTLHNAAGQQGQRHQQTTHHQFIHFKAPCLNFGPASLASQCQHAKPIRIPRVCSPLPENPKANSVYSAQYKALFNEKGQSSNWPSLFTALLA
jgi:hypothetical protein